MEGFKFWLGIYIIIICALILTLVLCMHLYHIKKPVFIVDNLVEISILTFVSMIMGLLLVIT